MYGAATRSCVSVQGRQLTRTVSRRQRDHVVTIRHETLQVRSIHLNYSKGVSHWYLTDHVVSSSTYIQLLDKQFQCTYEARTPTRINRSGEMQNFQTLTIHLPSAVYNDCSGDVVTSGPGNITVSPLTDGISYKMIILH